MKKKTEIKKRKIYEKVEEGMWSNAIIKYMSRPRLFEIKGVFITHTYRHTLRIDLYFVEVWIEWETKKRAPNKSIQTLMPTLGPKQTSKTS